MLVQVKSNQEKLLNDCIATTNLTKMKSVFEGEIEKSHGRIEKRNGTIYTNLKCIEDKEWKELIACVGVVERSREIFNPKNRQWEKTHESVYYICTTMLKAQELVTISRKHWGIENRNHYVRDVSLHEDSNTSKINPGILARLRSFTLNILRRNNKESIRQTLYENAINIRLLMKLKI